MNAWVEKFVDKVMVARNNELNMLFKRFIISIGNVVMIYTMYPIIAIVTFATTILGFKIYVSVPIAVASIQFLNMLKTSARWLPFFIGLLIEFLVSMDRIQEFLLSEEIDPNMVDDDLHPNDDNSIKVVGNFSWGFNHDAKVSELLSVEKSKVGESSHHKSNSSDMAGNHSEILSSVSSKQSVNE